MKYQKRIGVIALITAIMMTNVSVFAEEYEYDDMDRVTKVVYDDGSYVEYEYDINGNITKVNVHEVEHPTIEEPTEESTEDTGDDKEKSVVEEVVDEIKEIIKKIGDFFKKRFG